MRRTDKINTEAAFHKIEEYMYWVDLYYNKLEKLQAVEKRRVYIATDDPRVFPEAEEKYVYIVDTALCLIKGFIFVSEATFFSF